MTGILTTRWIGIFLPVLALIASADLLQAEVDSSLLFERDVFPILRAHCLKCHGLEGFVSELDLRTMSLIGRGGKHGAVLVPGSARDSRLYQRVLAGEMPPGSELKLTGDQVATIGRWIDSGAQSVHGSEVADSAGDVRGPAARDFWSFRKLDPPPVPTGSPARSPIDAFLLARLQPKGLSFSPQADKHVLVRRAHFDLIGLPPTAAEVESFVADTEPDAYERMVDRLLGSPHFGERWGRHWLDAAGYVDVTGGDNDAGIIKLSSTKWLYRDYVIQAFNDDLPFDRFLAEQLAGDELSDWRSAEQFTPELKRQLIATGFLRTAADDTDENELNTADIRHGVLQRTVETVASNLLGLTVQCARCHDHKYDPISQADYYRLQAVFSSAFNPQLWLQPKRRALADVPPARRAAMEAHNNQLAAKAADLKKQIAELHEPARKRLRTQKLGAIPEPIRDDTRLAIETPAADRNAVQQYLAAKFEAQLKVSPDELPASLTAEERAGIERVERQVVEANEGRLVWGEIQAAYDVGPPLPTYVLRRGSEEMPGAEVQPGLIRVLDPLPVLESAADSDPCSDTAFRSAAGQTSGRRLLLAQKLTDWSNPAGSLVARVQVNRVWQHLFGRGFVESSDNFGWTGSAPVHPELLEWLAGDFVANGRRFKPLIRAIMCSDAYRQQSSGGAGLGERVDPDNALLWRQRLRRLESEMIRDALLAVAGRLDRSLGGPPVPLEPRPDGTIVEQGSDPAAFRRRSLYLLQRRNYHPTLLAVFDQPALPTNCTIRPSSAVVSQSLTMLNDEFVAMQSAAFARNVAASRDSVERRIDAAFRTALGRSPTGAEYEWSLAFVNRAAGRAAELSTSERAERAMAELCHVLVNTSEFLFVE